MNELTNESTNNFIDKFKQAADDLQTAVLELIELQAAGNIPLSVVSTLSHDFKQNLVVSIEQQQFRAQWKRDKERRQIVSNRNNEAEKKAQEERETRNAIYRREQEQKAQQEAAAHLISINRERERQADSANRLTKLDEIAIERSRTERRKFDELAAEQAA